MNAVEGFLSADDRKIYTFDLFLLGLTERSLHLVIGFIAAFDAWNLVTAAPLVRLQIDNLVRLSYVASHPDMHSLAMTLLDMEFRELKDAKGRKLGDRRLVDLAKPRHPWVSSVYEAANGWIHLSPRQLKAPVSVDDVPGLLNVRVRYVVDDYREEFLGEVVGAMRHCTQEILAYLEMWTHVKNTAPPGLGLVTEIKAEESKDGDADQNER